MTAQSLNPLPGKESVKQIFVMIVMILIIITHSFNVHGTGW